MSPKRKYQLLLCGIVLLFVYVFTNYVVARWSTAYGEYKELMRKQEYSLDPSSFTDRIHELTAQRDSLMSLLISDNGEYEQSQAGVLELLAKKAGLARIHIKSIVPLDRQREGQLEIARFRIAFAAGFHDIGFYLNALETGSLPVVIRKLDLAVGPGSSSTAHGEMEGVAFFLASGAPQ